MAEKFKIISREELKKWLDEKRDFVLINVLSKNSFDAMRIPASKHADVHQLDFLEKVAKLVPDKNKTMVVYCASFTCEASPLAAQKLVNAGYKNVYDFKGGVADWQDAGYQLEGEAVK